MAQCVDLDILLQNCYIRGSKGNGAQTLSEAVKKDRNLMNTAFPQAATQHAALCWRRTGPDGVEILLVTSRDTGRWVLPKGWPKKDEAGRATALREAHEEAGVVGRSAEGCLGIYAYDKGMPDGSSVPCCVAVHVIETSHLDYRFPEMGQRDRIWFSPPDAADAVAEPELKALLANFRPGDLAGSG